jgi:excinuclease ABC subunit A
LAFEQSEGFCIIDIPGADKIQFSTRFECDGITFEEPVPQLFNFNSPYGACPKCEGFGTILGYDEDLIIPDKTLSLYEGAVRPWKGEKLIWWKDQFIKQASKINFPIHTPIMDLNEEQLRLLWNGAGPCLGIHDFFKEVEAESYKIQYRVLKSHYMGRTKCNVCNGSRLRPETQNVKIQNTSLPQLLDMTIGQLAGWFSGLNLKENELKIANRILVEISNRLKFMLDVGLEYLTLNRFSNTLSGGESQRINLTRSLGSNLTDALYILDEPSVGLHPHDTAKLVNVLKYLRDLGNTVIVVEHEEEVIRAADYLVDIGPEAGIHGGKVVFAGPYEALKDAKESLTTRYLNGIMEIAVPSIRRKSSDYIKIIGARHHNLKNINVDFPLKAITAVSGVSGSGKSTLVKEILYPALKLMLEGTGKKPGLHKSLEGATRLIHRIEMVDQNPIGRSSRSNPVTYIKAYDAIRELFATQSLSKVRGYQPKHFSFNVEGGRCEECQGEGEVLVEMQFLADIHLTCETCKGKRFKQEVLEVTFKEKSISDVLAMSVDEALAFFHDRKDIYSKLLPLSEVGLGYVQLGQSSSTLSGGEAQRVKLASFLHKGASKEHILFLFDEPTTGLHFHDISKLLKSFNALVEVGHTVIVVEHNIDVIKSADWLIDLGPKGGAEGGNLLYQGPPEGILDCKTSLTAPFLLGKLHAVSAASS